MRKFVVVKVLVFMFLGFIAYSQEEFSMEAPGYYEIKGEKDKIEIPFEIFNGDILVKPTINGVQSRMLVDNGTLWDQLYFFGSPILDSLYFEYIGDAIVGGAGDGDKITNKLAENVMVDFGDLTFYNQPAIISPPELGLQNMWTDVDGQVSAMFFKHFITEIDYDKMVIILHKPKEFKPKRKYTAIPMTFTGNGSFSIPVEIELLDGRTLKKEFILDLGGSTYFTYYYKQADNLEPDKNSELKILGYGIQGEIKGYEKEVEYFKMGDYNIEKIIGEFVDVTNQDGHKNSIIGLELLSQFNTILDYHNSVLYIQPNKNFNK